MAVITLTSLQCSFIGRLLIDVMSRKQCNFSAIKNSDSIEEVFSYILMSIDRRLCINQSRQTQLKTVQLMRRINRLLIDEMSRKQCSFSAIKNSDSIEEVFSYILMSIDRSLCINQSRLKQNKILKSRWNPMPNLHNYQMKYDKTQTENGSIQSKSS